jgi:glycosyltransferase involved in cell wall biosynthesis
MRGGVKSPEMDRKAARPALSICIPSYNRADMLAPLLRELDQPGLFPFPYEIVVVDNASPDPGYDAIGRFTPLHCAFRYYRRVSNIGGVRNFIGAYRLARGELCVVLADDDYLIASEVIAIVEAMLANPTLGATYAAWQAIDRSDRSIDDRFHFEDMTVFPAFPQALAERIGGWSLAIPENAIMRTDIVARAAYSSSVQNFAFTLLRQMLLFRSIRFSSRAFYQLTTDSPRDLAQGGRASSSYRFEGWSSMARGYSHFHFRATGERLFELKAGREEMIYLQLIRNAVYEAQNQGRMAEALEALDHLQSLTAIEMVTPEYERTLRFLASIDQMRIAIETLPDAPILTLVGIDHGIEELVRDTMSKAGSSLCLETVMSKTDLEVEGRAFLALTDLDRGRIIDEDGALPGYVFSIESLKTAFGF